MDSIQEMIDGIRHVVFDFDGVFTNNKVYVDANGNEYVQCDRGDGLGIKMLKKFFQTREQTVDIYILSTEKNEVVQARANKIGLKAYNGITSKLNFLLDKHKNSINKEKGEISGLLYVGNDLNDLEAMKKAQFTACPSDAHPMIKEISIIKGKKNGGDGFVREIIELIITNSGTEITLCA